MIINFSFLLSIKGRLKIDTRRKHKPHKPDPRLLTTFQKQSASPTSQSCTITPCWCPSGGRGGEEESLASQCLYPLPSPSPRGSREAVAVQKDKEEALLTPHVAPAGSFGLLAFSWSLDHCSVWCLGGQCSKQVGPAVGVLPPAAAGQGLWQCQAVLNTPGTSSPGFPPVVP